MTMTYMIVEDEPDLYEMLTAMSSVLEVNEVAFATGEEAVTWIEEVEAGIIREEIPALALIDLRLPGDIDGVMVAERMRSSPLLKNVAVVLMTAFHLTADEEKVVISRAEADLLMYKPLPKFVELRDILRNIALKRMNGKRRVRA